EDDWGGFEAGIRELRKRGFTEKEAEKIMDEAADSIDNNSLSGGFIDIPPYSQELVVTEDFLREFPTLQGMKEFVYYYVLHSIGLGEADAESLGRIHLSNSLKETRE